MAKFSNQAFDFYHQSPSSSSPSTLDTKPFFLEDDEMSVLDDKILDPTSPVLSSVIDHRKTSYDQQQQQQHHHHHHQPTDISSQHDSLWSDFASPFPAVSSSSSSNSRHGSQVLFNGSFSYGHQEQQHQHQHQNPWSLSRDSGSCTPSASYNQFSSSDLDNASTAPFSGGAVGPVSSIHMPPMSYRQGLAYVPTGAVTMSPQSSQGWVPAPTELTDTSSHPTSSPTYRNSPPLTLRRDAARDGIRDGIRKKNARFDIPAERTLSNIDLLISRSNNDEEIKELKQQKRLLRNRQAALDSRQRKKLHTEKLEEEKKQLTHIINDLEDALQSLKIRDAEMLREKGEWLNFQHQVNQYVSSMHMEKDELIRVHTLETADLRKKNNILKEAVEKLERQAKVPTAAAAAAATSTTTALGAGDEFSNFDSLAMDGGPWDDFDMVNNLSLETAPVSGSTVPSNTMITSTNDDKNNAHDKNSDYPFSWNAFYMCLLFGAFIASNSATLSSRSIPSLSEEYRAESANVLNAVLSSAPQQEPAPSANQAATAIAPSASARQLPTTISGEEMAQMTSGAGAAAQSTLDELHNTLALPTKEQEQEQIFSLTPDQYNSLTTYDESANFKQPQQSSNLQQALATMRSDSAQNKMQMKPTSDVYSRSLMWDRVPQKVIHDFRRMVQEYGASPVKREDHSEFV